MTDSVESESFLLLLSKNNIFMLLHYRIDIKKFICNICSKKQISNIFVFSGYFENVSGVEEKKKDNAHKHEYRAKHIFISTGNIFITMVPLKSRSVYIVFL